MGFQFSVFGFRHGLRRVAMLVMSAAVTPGAHASGSVMHTLAVAGPPIAIETSQRTDAVSFEAEILPVLRQNCLACHSASEKQGNLVLEAPDLIQRGGDGGPAVVPGKSDESLLLKLASHQQEPVMPPDGNDVAARTLTSQELGLLKLWIDQGARSSGASVTSSPRQMSALPANLKTVHAVAVSNDGRLVAFSRGNRVMLQQLATSQQGQLTAAQSIVELTDPALAATSGGAHQDLVQSLAMNADGDLVATGGFREIKIWRRPNDVQLRSIALDGNPSAMALNADKSLLAVAGPANSVRIIRTADGSLATTLTGHSDAVTSVRFFDDGTRVVSASVDKTVRLWNPADGAEVARFETPAPVHAVELVPLALRAADAPVDAPPPEFRIVTGHADNILRVWSLPTPDVPVTAPLREIGGYGGLITSLARVPTEAKQVFAGSMDTTVRRWNIEDGQQVQYFGHSGAVTAIAVSPDGQKLAATSDNRTARLWKIDGQQIAELRGDIHLRTALIRAQQQESAANTRLNVARQRADAAERDVPTRTEADRRVTEQLTAAAADVQAKKTMVDTTLNERLAAERAAQDASAAARAALQEQRTAEQAARDAAVKVQTAQTRLNRIQQSLNADPNNETLKQKMATAQTEFDAATQTSTAATAAIQAPTTRATELATAANQAAQKLETVQRPWADAVAALRTAEAAHKLLTIQQSLSAAELKTAQDLVPVRKEAVTQAEAALAAARATVQTANEQQQQAELPIRSIAFSPDGQSLATCGDFPGVHVWDANSGTARDALAGHTAAVRCLLWLDDQQLLSAGDDQTLRQWTATPGWQLERTIGTMNDPPLISHRVTALDFSADSSQLLVGSGVPSRSGELMVFTVSDGNRTLSLPQAHDDVVYSARFSPDMRRIASGGADKALRTFDVATSQQIRRFEGHTSHVLSVTWRRDGQMLASAGADNVIKVWDAETGDQQRTIENFNRHVTAVAFIGETENIVSSCGDKLVRMHNAANGGLFRNLGGAESWLHCVALTPDSSVVAAGDATGRLLIWNGNNGQLIQTLTP